jgi:hypothetical protein
MALPLKYRITARVSRWPIAQIERGHRIDPGCSDNVIQQNVVADFVHGAPLRFGM